VTEAGCTTRPAGLFQDQQRIVFVQDVKGEYLQVGLSADLLLAMHLNCSPAEAASFHYAAIHANVPFLD